MNKSYPRPNFPAIEVSKSAGNLSFKNLQRLSISIGNTGLSPIFSDVANSIISLIKEADSIYSFRDFEPVIINIGNSDDHYKWGVDNSLRILNYCTRWDNFDDLCPDFTFDRWFQAGYEDYDDFCKKVIDAGSLAPLSDKAVWRGYVNENRRVRNKILAMQGHQYLDIENVIHIAGKPDNCVLSDFYIPIDEQVRRYRYIVNANGQGHSKRLKIELFSGRVIFLVERRYLEWFNEKLKPWVHYVPIKQDCSDLLEKIEIVKSSPDIEQRISHNSRQFALKNLTKQNALERFNTLLNEYKSGPNDFSKISGKGRFTQMDCRDDDYREN